MPRPDEQVEEGELPSDDDELDSGQGHAPEPGPSAAQQEFPADDEGEVKQVQALLAQNREQLRDSLFGLFARIKKLEKHIQILESGKVQETQEAFEISLCPDAAENDEGRDYESQINGMGVMTDPGHALQPQADDAKDRVLKRVCFNCGADHMLSECPEPRDHRRIAVNRREFSKNQGVSSKRYYGDEEQKYAHVKPGLPSKKLKEALGLADGELPSYIYAMRRYGYPPGWMQEAEVVSSGMVIYQSQQSKNEAADAVEYNLSKVQEWPGFNVPIPENYRDDTAKHKARRMQAEHSKEELLRRLQPNSMKGYVKDSQNDEDEAAAEQQKHTPTKEEWLSGASSDSKKVEVGTPIVQMHSPFTQLPDLKKWECGVTDHIFFENLPDSTGHWDKMRNILKRQRSNPNEASATSKPDPVEPAEPPEKCRKFANEDN